MYHYENLYGHRFSRIQRLIAKVALILLLPTLLWGQGGAKPQPFNYDTTYTWRALALRAGMGVQRSFYFEIGPAFVLHETSPREGFASLILFSAFEMTPSRDIYGVKVGCDYGILIANYGFELKYLTDNKNNGLVFTPKIGLGLGFVNINYGYNVSQNKFPSIGKHQFSLQFNLTKKFFRAYKP